MQGCSGGLCCCVLWSVQTKGFCDDATCAMGCNHGGFSGLSQQRVPTHQCSIGLLLLLCSFCPSSYIWLLLLPFGIFPEGSWWSFVPVSVMVMMMLGLEDLAVQLEDPFQSFPHSK
jgi:hypothetical protein